MDGVGNGVAVDVEALQDEVDFVDVFRCAALEAARLHGVVDTGVRHHGGQAQGGT
jgi:predicted CoA-binding protein